MKQKEDNINIEKDFAKSKGCILDDKAVYKLFITKIYNIHSLLYETAMTKTSPYKEEKSGLITYLFSINV